MNGQARESIAILPRPAADLARGLARTLRCLAAACVLAFWLPGFAGAQTLPDSPGALLLLDSPKLPDDSPSSTATRAAEEEPPGQTTSPTRRPHCNAAPQMDSPEASAASHAAHVARQHCQEENPVQSVVSRPVRPLTVRGKALLAVRDFDDPFNFITIAGYSGISVAANAHSAFGPGVAGWGRLTGYSLLEDAQGEFVGTFLIPSLVHQDPRYHRLPDASFRRRLLHAIAHTYVSQHDDGTRMPNYTTLINYPVSAELANLYVPGIQTDGPSTVRRFCIGIATDPSGTIVAEFLPDIARHIHVHVIFVQEIVNQVITGGTAPNVQ